MTDLSRVQVDGEGVLRAKMVINAEKWPKTGSSPSRTGDVLELIESVQSRQCQANIDLAGFDWACMGTVYPGNVTSRCCQHGN